MDEKIQKLQEYVDEAEKIVFFGGAGVSTESGVPDFRSEDGLYHQKYKYPPEVILSHSFYRSKPKDFYDFYYEKILVDGIGPDATGEDEIKPNKAHLKLAEMEQKGKLLAVVTQNIDGLHQKAGSKRVYELHGSIHRNYCESCGKFFDGGYVLAHKADGVLKCDACGGEIKPDVVLYEEGLDQKTLEGAVRSIAEADLLIIGGTSLAVYPAAGLIDYFRGKHLVLINKSKTERDQVADLVISDSIGEVLDQIHI
ncbi:MAG: NAD-dependent protein deacylase [Lachnospiraceae bacterium]|nr:NAD-dependent protein deacylase [Lachnospiraceae bacterium]